MDAETIALLADLHVRNARQGPGSEAATLQALALLELAGLDRTKPLAIADIGCGTGAAALPLLRETNATITAVDLLPQFLEALVERATAAGVVDRITTIEADMAELPFREGQFDVLWAEGAIYNIGFTRGITDWQRFLKPGGMLVVSEITWRTTVAAVPEPLRAHWEREYPEVAPAAAKLSALEAAGYASIGYFPLPPACWRTEYYAPLSAGFPDFLARHEQSAAARAIVENEQHEIELYTEYQDFVSYGVYLAAVRG